MDCKSIPKGQLKASPARFTMLAKATRSRHGGHRPCAGVSHSLATVRAP
jgi:hypothetical protein